MDDIRARLASLTPEQRQRLRRSLDRTGRTAAEPARSHPPAAEPAGAAPTPSGPPRWSLFFFSAEGGDPTRTYQLVLDSARFADAHGFHAVWVPERHFDPFGAPYPDPAVLAAAIAATTERIRIRAGSVVLPLHDPLLVAERWAMVDNLSRGRVDISLASGWHTQDFTLSPGSYAGRKEILTDRLAELRALWRGESVERTDGAGETVRVSAYPRPWQSGLNLWLTSSSNPATWESAGRLGVNVLTALLEQGLDDVAEKVGRYGAARAAAGSPAGGAEVTLMLHTLVGADPAEVRRLARPPLLRYLRGHIDLFEKLVRSQGIDINLENVTEQDKQMLVEMAFERYFTTNGLFGTPESALDRVAAITRAGVTEIACLIDFGVEPDRVLHHLHDLHRLKLLADEAFAPATPAPQDPARTADVRDLAGR